jgi:hypothetical protein
MTPYQQVLSIALMVSVVTSVYSRSTRHLSARVLGMYSADHANAKCSTLPLHNIYYHASSRHCLLSYLCVVIICVLSSFSYGMLHKHKEAAISSSIAQRAE